MEIFEINEGEAPKTEPYQVKAGDMFTIDGFGLSAKGKLVVDGYLFGTRRKCRSVKPMVYKVKAVT